MSAHRSARGHFLALSLGVSTSLAAAQEPAPSVAPGAALLPESQPAPPPPAPESTQGQTPPTAQEEALRTPGAAVPPVPPAQTTPALPVQRAPLTPPPAPEPAGEETPKVPAWTEHLSLGGGAILWYYQPTNGDEAHASIYNASLLIDGKWGAFGFHLEPRFRDTRLRPFFDGPSWVQEAYASISFDPVVLKAGKVYKRSGGLFWDNSFYGNVQVYDGLKLDPNYGLSLEGSLGDRLGLDFAAQFFVLDGRTNVSLQGRDTISIPGAYRRNTFAARLEPWLQLGENAEARLGLSAEHFTADFADTERGVTRLGADAKIQYSAGDAGAFAVWGEFVHQNGRHVLDHPLEGSASGSNAYFLLGAEYSIWRFTLRYNVSHASYSDVDTTETMHVPALGITIDEHLNVLGEYVIWRQNAEESDLDLDKSVNVTLNAHF